MILYLHILQKLKQLFKKSLVHVHLDGMDLDRPSQNANLFEQDGAGLLKFCKSSLILAAVSSFTLLKVPVNHFFHNYQFLDVVLQ